MMARMANKSVLNKRMALLAGAALLAATAAVLYVAIAPPRLSGTPSERVAAIHKMAVDRPRGAGPVLADAAENDPSAEVRGAAVGALSYFLEPEFRAAVVKCTADADARVRAVAAGTLGLYYDAEAADVLADMVAGEDEEQVVLAALDALAACDAPMAIVALLEAGAKGRGDEVRMVAMRSLLRKYEGKVPDKVSPSDERKWRDLLQRWRRFDKIKDAYAAAGVELIDRPGDIIGRDHHPDRHDD